MAPSSQRPGLIASASRKLSDLSLPKRTKERLSGQDVKSKTKISPPSDFRDLSNDSSSSNSISNMAANNTTPQVLQHSEQRLCRSPMDKPLPSLPVATITTKSPISARRSLIDAQEKPLRRSLSPSLQTIEDWPSLSPKKQRTSPIHINVPVQVKASISEGLAERIKMLKIDDAAESDRKLPDQEIAHATSFSASLVPPANDQSKRPPLSTKPKLPAVRHTKTSELRMRLSASNLDDSKARKSNQPSPLGDTSGNITARARGIKRVSEKSRGRSNKGQSRSRSRHRVTAEGSPYMLPPDSNNNNQELSNPRSSLVLDPRKVDTNFSRPSSGLRTPAVFGGVSDRQASHAEQEDSSRTPAYSDQGEGFELRQNTILKGEYQLPLMKKDHNSNDSAAKNDTTSFKDETDFEAAFEPSSGLDLDTNNERITTQSLKSDTEPETAGLAYNHTQDDYLHDPCVPPTQFSSDWPGQGPLLGLCPRTGEAAIAGKGGANAAEVMDRLNSFGEIDTQQDSELDSSTAGFTNCVSPSDNLTEGPEAYSIPRKPLTSNLNLEKPTVLYTKPSAPPIKATLPHDDDFSTAWPFKESVFVPFRTGATPERVSSRAVLDSTEKNSQSGVSQPRLVHGKYNIAEALGNIQPVEVIADERAAVDNQNQALGRTAMPSEPAPAFPARTTSRLNSASKITGLRTPSARAATLTFNNPSTGYESSTKLSSSVRKPHHMRSFSRSAQNLNSIDTTDSRGKNKPLPSPAPVVGTVSTGKAVINNVRGLFHRRTNLHNSIYGSLRHPLRNKKSTPAVKISPTSTTGSTISRTPRSPQVRGTSTVYRYREEDPTARVFPINRVVRPFASSSPTVEQEHSAPTSATTSKPINTTPKATPTTTTNLQSFTTNEPAELQSATSLVHHLLSLVEKDDLYGEKQRQMLELSKLLVSLLSSARDAEKALQQAHGAASICQMKCLETRRDVARIEALVRLLTGQVDEKGRE